MLNKQELKVVMVPIEKLVPYEKNARKWTDAATNDLRESITRFGQVDALLVNRAPGRENIVIGGAFRLKVMKELGFKEAAVIYLNISDPKKEAELNIRLNKNLGDWDTELLAEFDESLLKDIGFSSEELDDVFSIEDKPETFDLQKELDKLDIKTIEMQKGDIWDLDGSRIMVGDSTVEADVLKLMGDEKADMCLTDPPYILDYLNAHRHGKATEGFGAKRNRRYLETDVLPDDFTEKWMANIAKVQKESFSIIVYENWKNIRTIWGEMEKHWKVKNMIVWHLPNRNQAFASKYKFFSKHDIAMVGASKDSDVEFNLNSEEEGLQNEYETALYAIAGKPHWESYSKGKKVCPTDFIDFNAADEKSSGQGIIFGTKPLEILIPYVKVLTKRDDLIVEPFGGSGSSLIASIKMKRRCYLMEKSPIYAEVIRNRWEKLTGLKAKKIGGQGEK
ncbi:MAG: DNA methylase [bacterium ADurb.BinA186]|nr:MAG: DNA methylase [bacterium ADurb.BinA186]